MEVNGKKVLVFGAGISGVGAAKLLEEHQAEVILYDGNQKLDEEEMKKQLGEKSNVRVLLGELPGEVEETLDMAVLSPGVPTDLPVVRHMESEGVTIIGEIELAYEFGKGDVLAITGTNGKTTTTSLLGEIMKKARSEVYVVGNIGNPYTSVAGQMTDQAVTVAEVSSFQLETIDMFRPKVSAILNITPDHLNRHHTMEAYIQAKENIARNQREEDYCILNYEDEVTREFGRKVKAKVLYFSSQRKLEEGIYLEDGKIVCSLEGKKEIICHIDELQILGTHNHENVMAAAGMAYVYGVPVDTIRRGVKEFRGVEHRIEYVTEKNGVAYYNDSKGDQSGCGN